MNIIIQTTDGRVYVQRVLDIKMVDENTIAYYIISNDTNSPSIHYNNKPVYFSD
jgi:hypothetical protein